MSNKSPTRNNPVARVDITPLYAWLEEASAVYARLTELTATFEDISGYKGDPYRYMVAAERSLLGSLVGVRNALSLSRLIEASQTQGEITEDIALAQDSTE